jgi:hypothetical protein
MNDAKKNVRLDVVQEKCFEAIEKYSCTCEKKSCKQWINFPKGRNCMLVTTQAGPLTLNEIGKIYGLTRMRICQIEKSACQKIRSTIR